MYENEVKPGVVVGNQEVIPMNNMGVATVIDSTMPTPPIPDQEVRINGGVNIYEAFDTLEMAERAVAAALDHGLTTDCISVFMRDGSGRVDFGATNEITEHATGGLTATTPDDAKQGAAKGAGIGLGVGILAGLVSIALPGFGLVLAGPALATAIAGAAGAGVAGAVSGGMYGYLRDQGADEETAQAIRGRFDNGEVVVAFRCDDIEQGAIVRTLAAKYNGEQVVSPGTSVPGEKTEIVGTTTVVDTDYDVS